MSNRFLILLGLSVVFAQKMMPDDSLSQLMCSSFQIGNEFIENAFIKMMDQYLDRYHQKPKLSHESIKKGLNFDHVLNEESIGLNFTKDT